MSEYYSILTQKGEQALFESIANQTAFNPLYMAVGDSSGSYYEPEETQTALKNEKYRAQIHFKGINKKDNFIYFTLQIPPSEGDYTIRELGLFSEDNELLGIAKYPETLKQKADTQSDKTLSVEFQIFLSNKTINTIIIDNNANPLLNLDAQPYDENRIYFKTEWATGIIDNQKSIFESLTDQNQGNPLTDETKWKKVSLGGAGKELLEIYLDPFIDETKNTGRILNGQVIIQDQFQSAVSKLKRSIGTLTDVFNPLSVQKYGDIEITSQGVASGFNSTSWVTIPKPFNPQNQSFEIGIDFTTGTIGTKQQIISTTNYAYQALSLEINANGKINAYSNVNNTEARLFDITSDFALSANTQYYAIIQYNSNSGYTLKLGENKNNVTVIGTSNVTTPIPSSLLAFGADFGANGAYYDYAFSGSVNLFNSYVKINDEYFFNPKKQVYSLMPEIACSEDEWQTIKTMSVIGQVPKFVIDDEAGTIRLPAIKNIQGVYSLQSAGAVVNQSLPNLKWEINSNSTSADFSFFGEWYNGLPTTGGIKAELITTNKAIAEAPASGAQRLYKLSYNANEADSTYQDNAPVQQEACGYPYCICLNPEVEETDKPINEYEIINCNTLLESKYTPLILNNLSWLRSTGQRNDGNTYTAVWNKLIESYNTNSKIGIADVKLVTDSTATDYDFKIDLDTNEFILPLLDGSEDLLSSRRDELALKSEYIAPANGWYFMNAIGTGVSGNVYVSNETKGYATQNNTVGEAANVYIEVKRGDKVLYNYHDVNNPVARFIHATGNGNLYYYVGNIAQNPNITNLSRMEEKLIDKTDKQQASHASMPSNQHIDNIFNPTVTATQQRFTAPCDGVVYIQNTTNKRVYLASCKPNGPAYCAITLGDINGSVINGWVKIAKGDVACVQTDPGNTTTITTSHFTKNQGEV